VGNTLWSCLIVPCLWPLLIAAPLVMACAKMDQNRVKNQYWILTTAELKIVTMDYECPGCCGASSGTSVRTIALEDITGGGVRLPGKRCCDPHHEETCCCCNSCCSEALPTFNVTYRYYDETTHGAIDKPWAVGTGLLDHASFLQKILDQRDVVKGTNIGTAAVPTTTAIATIEPMQRGGGGIGESSPTQRMKHVKDLYENGLISSNEYEAKRQDILAGL
jgi:hypothetical protein